MRPWLQRCATRYVHTRAHYRAHMHVHSQARAHTHYRTHIPVVSLGFARIVIEWLGDRVQKAGHSCAAHLFRCGAMLFWRRREGATVLGLVRDTVLANAVMQDTCW